MGIFGIWAFMSEHKIQKFPCFVQTTLGIHHFHPNLSGLHIRVQNSPKLTRLRHQALKNRPGLPRISGMAYRTVRKPFRCRNECKLAFSYHSKGISPEPPPPPSIVTAFFPPFLLTAFRIFTACPTCSNFCLSPKNISKSVSSSRRVRASVLREGLPGRRHKKQSEGTCANEMTLRAELHW